MYNPWTSGLLYESEYLHGQSPDYEWTDMVRSKEYHKPENVEITVHGCSMRRGQMIVIYGLGDGIVLALLAETGNVTKTRLDRHSWIWQPI